MVEGRQSDWLHIEASHNKLTSRLLFVYQLKITLTKWNNGKMLGRLFDNTANVHVALLDD